MEKRNQQRRPSRPVSELITLFSSQKAEKPKRGQWQSASALSCKEPSKVTHKRHTSSLIPPGNSELSKSSESVPNFDTEEKCNKDGSKSRTTRPTEKPKPVKLALKPTKMPDKAVKPIETPREKETEGKRKEKDEKIKPPDSLKKEIKKKEDPQRKISSGSESESCTRQKFPLDDSLAVLRREMHSLRKQDVELMTQLLALNSSIQEIKSHSSSSSISNYSDTSDTETDVTEIEIQPTLRSKAWHQRESSGSDTDFEPRRALLRPSTCKQTNVNRDSLGSEVSGYYSNPSPRSSLYGSNRSLNAYDVSSIEPTNHSEYGSPHSMSPVSCEPPFAYAYHCRQKTMLSQDFLGLGMTGSEPTLNRNYPDEDKLQPPVYGRACYHGDDVRRMSAQQKSRLCSRRNTAQSIASDLSRSGSEYSLSGYDVDSDNSRSSATSSRLDKWQRSKSTCALDTSHNTISRPPIKNTIKVDLRNNPPMPGTAIELILPIQPLQPTTRRNSAVRMAERRPVEKLNTLSKRQSTIW